MSRSPTQLWSFILMILTLIGSLSVLFLPASELLNIAVLTIPLCVIISVACHPNSFSIIGQKNSKKVDLAYGFLIPGIAVLVSLSFGGGIIDWHKLHIYALIFSGILLYFVLKADKNLKRSKILIFAAALSSVVYSYAFNRLANSAFEQKSYKTYQVEILDKWVSKGKSRIPTIKISVFGPQTEPTDISLKAADFKKFEISGTACVDIMQGNIGIQWFAIKECEK